MPSHIQFTPHAIQRFVERHAPEMDLRSAEEHLVQIEATRLKERTVSGDIQYQIEDPRCLLVVKRDPRCNPDLICVTVLPCRSNKHEWTEEENEIAAEWLEDQKAAGKK